MRSNKPQGIGGLITGSLKAFHLDRRVKENTALLVWDEIVGDQVSSAAQPEFVRDGILFAVVKSSVWANELTFYKSDMIARLNRRVGGNVLKDIVFKAGRMPSRRSQPPTTQSNELNLEGIPLSERELEKVEAAAKNVGADASDALRNLLMTAARLDKWKEAQGWKPCKKCGALQNTESGICPLCQRE